MTTIKLIVKYLQFRQNIKQFAILPKISISILTKISISIKGYENHLRISRSQNVYIYSLFFRKLLENMFQKMIKVNYEKKKKIDKNQKTSNRCKKMASSLSRSTENEVP